MILKKGEFSVAGGMCIVMYLELIATKFDASMQFSSNCPCVIEVE